MAVYNVETIYHIETIIMLHFVGYGMCMVEAGNLHLHNYKGGVYSTIYTTYDGQMDTTKATRLEKSSDTEKAQTRYSFWDRSTVSLYYRAGCYPEIYPICGDMHK